MNRASIVRALFAVAIASLLAACAHPVKITPQLYLEPADRLNPAAVGYHISNAQRELRVTTAGGGGDKITYALYADLEPGLFATLSSVFESVHVVPEAGSDEYIRSRNLRFVFRPTFDST